jgi:ectoine hydroxylase
MPVIDDVYPSRIDGRARLIERVDPVVYRQTGRKGPFTAAEVDTSEEQGFLVKPSLFARNEIVDLNEALTSWVHSPDLKGLEETITEPNSGAVRSIFRVHELHPLYRQLARDDRLLGAASQILGSDARPLTSTAPTTIDLVPSPCRPPVRSLSLPPT